MLLDDFVSAGWIAKKVFNKETKFNFRFTFKVEWSTTHEVSDVQHNLLHLDYNR